jgi:manganese/zinc/iron transport system permease protein
MTTVAFDEGFATASGLNVPRLDRIAMLLVLFVTVAGLRIVGLVLIVALLIIPAVAARFWTDRVSRLLLVAALIGGASGWIGTALSAAAPGLPAGPLVVLVATAIFALSLLFAPKRGAIARALATRRAAPRLTPRDAALWVALRRADPRPRSSAGRRPHPPSALLPPERLRACEPPDGLRIRPALAAPHPDRRLRRRGLRAAGNVLLLRRQALLGDAVAHVVLPGIVVAFLLTGTVAPFP